MEELADKLGFVQTSLFLNLSVLFLLFSSFCFTILREYHGTIERFSIECRKTKTKVITLANHKGHR